MSFLVLFFVELSKDAHGVLREAWYNVNYNSKKAPTMRENPAFQPPAQSRIVLRDFDAPTNVGEKYVQRLTSYLQVQIAFHILTPNGRGRENHNIDRYIITLTVTFPFSKLPHLLSIDVYQPGKEAFDPFFSPDITATFGRYRVVRPKRVRS